MSDQTTAERIVLHDTALERGTRHLVVGLLFDGGRCSPIKPVGSKIPDIGFGTRLSAVPPGYRTRPYHWGEVNGRLRLLPGPDPRAFTHEPRRSRR